MKNLNITLKEHNLKSTPQRLAILESIFNHGHINIDKLYEEIKTKFRSISQATIYKNIKSLTLNNILYEVKLPSSKSVYEIKKHEHSHLLCKKCEEVIDIPIDIRKDINNISKEYNFYIEQSDLVLSGYCKSCFTP